MKWCSSFLEIYRCILIKYLTPLILLLAACDTYVEDERTADFEPIYLPDTEQEEENRYTKVTPQFGPKKLHVHTIDGTILEDGTEKQSIVTSRYRYRSGVFYKKNASPPKEKIIPPSTYN